MQKKVQSWRDFATFSCICQKKVVILQADWVEVHDIVHQTGHEISHETGYETGHETGHEISHETGHEREQVNA